MSNVELDKESFYEKKHEKLIASTSIKMFPLFFIMQHITFCCHLQRTTL